MKIVVAEDDRITRTLLSSMLGKWGHDVICTRDGVDAWQALQAESQPFVAMLDWMMPGLTGTELCERLRDRSGGPFVYAILISAKSKHEDKIEALDSGAHAFINKPFESGEVQSCLAVANRVLDYEISLSDQNRRLQDYAAKMEELAAERSRQLLHADRMATLGLLAAGVAHEVNNPATFISGNAQTLAGAWPAVEAAVLAAIASGSPDASRLRFVVDEFPAMLAGIRAGVVRIKRITDGLKSYARQDRGERMRFCINHTVESALDLCHNRLKYTVAVKTTLAEGVPAIIGDATQVEQVLVNLFVNAGDAMKQDKEQVLDVRTSVSDGSIVLTVDDSGPGLPDSVVGEVFKPFFTTKPEGEGTGLGLSISHGIIEDHGGTLTAETLPRGGARFTITLPIADRGAGVTPALVREEVGS